MRLRVLDSSTDFSCGSCTKCCDQPWGTLIEEAKAHALDAADFSAHPQLAGRRFYSKSAGAPPGYFVLAKGEGTKCLFLDRDGLCIIHKELGPEAKPGGCLKFPYIVARTPIDDRISLDFACPAVQASRGKPLAEQLDDIEPVIPLTPRPPNPDARIPLDPEIDLSVAESDALMDRLVSAFEPDQPGDIWERFATALTWVVGVRRYKKSQSAENDNASGQSDDALVTMLRAGERLPEMPDPPAVNAFAQPQAAPSPARLLFAATLFRDTCPADAPLALSLWKRLTLMPKLMSLARLNGAYASRLLGRNVNIQDALNHPVAAELDPVGTDLLLRYYRSRFWQRYLCGTRMSISAGLHQHILDLDAILFVARAEAQHRNQPALDASLVRYGLDRVEFLLANQPRLFDEDNVIAWIRAQMESPAVAMQSLRLMSLHPARDDSPGASGSEGSNRQAVSR
jgi:Fe-S-cluster containining protein